MTLNLDCITLEPNKTAKATVIWLHGLGADGNDFVPIVPHLNLPDDLAVRFIFPNAPSLAVTINNGYVMPAWYDILAMDIERKVDETQLKISAQAIQKIIQQEIDKGIASDQIILAGFSQGGAVCYEAALSFHQPLAGVLALSTYFATFNSINWHESNQHTNIQIMHGAMDAVVPEALGIKAYEQLKTRAYPCSYQAYPMDHEVCLTQIQDIGRWIQSRLA